MAYDRRVLLIGYMMEDHAVVLRGKPVILRGKPMEDVHEKPLAKMFFFILYLDIVLGSTDS